MTDKQLTTEYDVIFVANEKGGVRKTSVTIVLADIAMLLGRRVHVFEIDEQKKVGQILSECSTNIALARAEELLDDDMADNRALDPAFNACCDPSGGRLVICDVGANLDGRVCESAVAADLDEELIASCKRVAIVVPYLSTSDAILAAQRTIRRMRVALPSATIIPARCQDGASLSDNSQTDSVQLALSNVIVPLEAETNKLTIPLLRPKALAMLERLAVRPSIFVDIETEVMARRANITQTEARAIKSQIKRYLAYMAEAAEASLGFRAKCEAGATEIIG